MFQSVTGSVYVNENGPVVTLFTKEGCTLCDTVKDVLKTLDHSEYPHTLEQVDINELAAMISNDVEHFYK